MAPFERNLKVVAGAAIFFVVSFLPIIGEKGAVDSIISEVFCTRW